LLDAHPPVDSEILQRGRGRSFLLSDEKDESPCPKKYGRGEQRKMVKGKSGCLNTENIPKLWPIPFGLYGDAPPPSVQ
jgi:hypothetical protein